MENTTQSSLLRLLDALTDKLDTQTLSNLLTQARLTDYDFEMLKSEIENFSMKDSAVDYILENEGLLDEADNKELYRMSVNCLTGSQKFEAMKDYLDTLTTASKSDKAQMLELHEILEIQLDTSEPLRNKIYNLTDTMGSVLDELESESPDYAKVIKWLKSDLESENK